MECGAGKQLVIEWMELIEFSSVLIP